MTLTLPERPRLSPLGEAALSNGLVEPPLSDEPPEDGYGETTPEPDVLPPPANPMAVARELVADYQHADGLTLRHWRGVWMRWDRTCWIEHEDASVRSWLYKRLEHAQYQHSDPKSKEVELKPWQPNRHRVANVLDALAATTHLNESIDPPAWLDDSPVPAGQMVACRNGLLDIGSKKIRKLTPRYFNRVAVPFDWDPATPQPERWLRFLGELWPDDPDSIAAL